MPRPSPRLASAVIFAACAGVAAIARAAPPAKAEPPPTDDETLLFSDRFVFDSARHEYPAPEKDTLTFKIRGEYQLRYRAQTDLPLEPPALRPEERTLGQKQYLYHWLRIGARFQVRDKFAIVGQIDVPRGFVVGDATMDVNASRDSFAEPKWYGIHPRALYLEYKSPIGLLRVGQQTSHWGMGLVANDGDHPPLFGDYRRGSISERVLFATEPFGEGTPLFVALAGDLIFQDPTADLLNKRDHAFQGVLAVAYRTRAVEIAFYSALRHQTRAQEATASFTPFVDRLTAGVLDWSGRFHAPIPSTRAFAYGAVEAALILGSTTEIRGAYGNPIDPGAPRDPERVRSFGAAATLGAVHVAGHGKDTWGAVVGEFEGGYATGDANPIDGVSKRFTFDENHHVGLVLFDQVLRWKTARAATIAQDPALVARGAPGLDLLPSNGGIFGAEYINARAIVRPRRWLDLKGGVLIAQTTSDLVDPYRFGALGSAQNYDGGDSRRHDLGVELDLGADARFAVDRAATVQAGLEGGVLFPGHAFDDAAGHKLPNQYLANLKLGLQF